MTKYIKIFWNPHFKWLNETIRKILLFFKIEKFIGNSNIVACNGWISKGMTKCRAGSCKARTGCKSRNDSYFAILPLPSFFSWWQIYERRFGKTILEKEMWIRNYSFSIFDSLSTFEIEHRIAISDLIHKVHIFWEGHKILGNLQQLFVLCTASQIFGGDFAKF